MLVPKSVIDLVAPFSLEHLADEDEAIYPFTGSLNLGDQDVDAARKLVSDVFEWLDTTIGSHSKWSISYPAPHWWGYNEEKDDNNIIMIFLFKTEEDAVAFKLRWT